MADTNSPSLIDLTSPPAATTTDTLPIHPIPTLEKRPSTHDLTQQDSEPSSPTKKQKTEGIAGVDTTAAQVTEIPNSQAPTLMVKKLSEKGRAPTRGSEFAAGYDVYSAHNTLIPAHGRALVDTDISIAVPPGTYGRIAPRSGLAVKNFIDVGAGVIDADYRGQVKVLLFNHSDTEFEVKEGDRVAQLILERIYTPEVVVMEELPESLRGAGGFGSTGGHASLV